MTSPTWSPELTKEVELFLCRHGDTDGNHAKILQGDDAASLNEAGRLRLRRLAAWLRPRLKERPVGLWSSPIQRAVETALGLQQALEIEGQLQQHPGLREYDFGAFRAKKMADLRGHPEWEAYLRQPLSSAFPEGESLPQIGARAINALSQIVESAQQPCLIVVSHGGVNRLILATLLGLAEDRVFRLQLGNCSVVRMVFRPGGRVRVTDLAQFAATNDKN